MKENAYYEVVEKGINIGFPYTPLFTNYEATSPRNVPIGIIIKTSKLTENTTFYDGMPVTTKDFKCLLSGFKSDPNYGNSTLVWVSCSQIDKLKIREISKEEYNSRYGG